MIDFRKLALVIISKSKQLPCVHVCMLGLQGRSSSKRPREDLQFEFQESLLAEFPPVKKLVFFY